MAVQRHHVVVPGHAVEHRVQLAGIRRVLLGVDGRHLEVQILLDGQFPLGRGNPQKPWGGVVGEGQRPGDPPSAVLLHLGPQGQGDGRGCGPIGVEAQTELLPSGLVKLRLLELPLAGREGPRGVPEDITLPPIPSGRKVGGLGRPVDLYRQTRAVHSKEVARVDVHLHGVLVDQEPGFRLGLHLDARRGEILHVEVHPGQRIVLLPRYDEGERP